MTLSQKLWLSSKKEAFFSYHSPFVLSLASGTLELEAFRHYIAQDFHFLQAFAHAYEVAGECAGDDEVGRVLWELREAVLEELEMHSSVVEEWGVNIAKETTPNPATLKYTDFLLSTAKGIIEGYTCQDMYTVLSEKAKIAAYTVGSMVPCMRLYTFLGKELQMLVEPEECSHPYRTWIDTYSSTSFEASTRKIEELLDNLCIPLTGHDLEVIQKLYVRAMNLEVEFFFAQPVVQPTVVPLTRFARGLEHHVSIFADFDLTCTVVDSCAVLAEVAISTATRNNKNPDEPHTVKITRDLRRSWVALSVQYFEEYEQCLMKFQSVDLVKEKVFDYKDLFKVLEELSEFEKLANSRVVACGLLKGVDRSEIEKAGRQLKFMNGCLDFLRRIREEELNVDLHVLSFCWCRDLLRSAFSSGGLSDMNIYSNDLQYENSISTGEIIRRLETTVDKASSFRRILNESECIDKHISIYIGDSLGDLLCLLEADVGIVVGSNGNLRRVAGHFGVTFEPLIHGLVEKQRRLAQGELRVWRGFSGTLYTVSGWEEIHAFISGP